MWHSVTNYFWQYLHCSNVLQGFQLIPNTCSSICCVLISVASLNWQILRTLENYVALQPHYFPLVLSACSQIKSTLPGPLWVGMLNDFQPSLLLWVATANQSAWAISYGQSSTDLEITSWITTCSLLVNRLYCLWIFMPSPVLRSTLWLTSLNLEVKLEQRMYSEVVLIQSGPHGGQWPEIFY